MKTVSDVPRGSIGDVAEELRRYSEELLRFGKGDRDTLFQMLHAVSIREVIKNQLRRAALFGQSFMRGTVMVPNDFSLRWQCGHSFSISPV